jgi:hypothetical protein
MKWMLMLLLGVQCAFCAPRPAQIHVGSKIFAVYYSTTYPKDFIKEVDSTDRLLGLTHCPDSDDKDQNPWIEIDPTLSLSQMRDTLFHEVHHAMNNCADGPTSMDWDAIYPYMIPQEIQLLRENPELVKFLTE